jgi:aspartate/methionine/tyrosine aminotransferase
MPLREAIAQYISHTRGIPVNPTHVVVAPGGKPIMFYAIMALVEAGDEVVMPNPAFPIYESMIRCMGGTPRFIPLNESEGFAFDMDVFARSLNARTKMVILNSPGNPTGGVQPQSQIEEIARLLQAWPDVVVLSDEIYSQTLYDDAKHFSIASVPGMQERTIILDGFSKTYAMTGWRLGYGVMNETLVKEIANLQINCASCVNAATQVAGIEALTGPQDAAREMVRTFDRRRALIVKGLNEIPGISCVMPVGAFYAFPNVTQLPISSSDLARRLLDESGVAVLSGTAFGEYGQGYLRLSYANSEANIQRALERIADFVGQLPQA